MKLGTAVAPICTVMVIDEDPAGERETLNVCGDIVVQQTVEG